MAFKNPYLDRLFNSKRSTGKRIYAAIALLLVSSILLTATSYAWLLLSRRPEVTGVSTAVGANGNLEIALGKNIGESAVGDSFDKNEVTVANRTWGNLVDLSDTSYGLQEIVLRPAMLNAAGGAVNTLHPFAFPVYSEDGRIERLYANNVFAGTFNGTWFTTSVNDYGVRGIGATLYNAPGEEGTFGPLSQRQEIYDQACSELWGMMQSSYTALCRNSQSVLMAYCYYGVGVSAADFNLNTFSEKVDAVVSAANEELRCSFTILAAAEMTSSEDYFAAMDLLGEAYPDYESVQPLVETAIQATGAADVGEAIAELRAFQDAAAQLQRVIASGEINSSDGYSMEEIAQTVGLIFDLEKTRFTIETRTYDNIAYDYIYNSFYSNVISDLYYQIPYFEKSGWVYLDARQGGSSVFNLTSSLDNDSGHQDNDSRESIANYIINSHIEPLYNSLRLADLDQAVIGLYASHWNYWDDCADEYKSLQDQADALKAQIKQLEEQSQVAGSSELVAELQRKTAELVAIEEQIQTLMDAEIYDVDDNRLETIRTVMTDTIESMRQYTLWSIAYFACDGQVPDDAYHRMLEIADSSAYTHPRTAYRTLCNYGVTPTGELTQMVAAFEKLERELLFLQRESKDEDGITWPEVQAELQRVFGTITHTISFHIATEGNGGSSYAYSRSYSPEDTSAPTEAMTKIREEIDAFKTAKDEIANYRYTKTEHHIRYGSYEENQLWSQSLGLLYSLYSPRYAFDYGDSEYAKEDLTFDTSHSMYYTENYWFDISIGVGSEDNFNESGLTVRQTRFQKAQESISNHQNALITAAVNMDKDMVTLLTQMIAGQSSVSLTVISDYLTGLQQQVDHAEAMMYQAALAMAASDYANDTLYRRVYSDSTPKDAASLVALLQQSNFDEKVLTAFTHRMELLNNQRALLKQSAALLENYQDPTTGALTAEQISSTEAATLLNPVLDTDSLTLYGYVAEERVQNGETNTASPGYVHTVLYAGFGSPSVQINGNKATIGNREPITVFGDVYLSLGHSLSGGLLALAKTQVETYTPPAGSLSAEDVVNAENGMNRQFYAIGTGENVYTLNLRTADAPYALATNLWTYTGNTKYISANQILIDLYGYCIDLSLRTNAETSDLLLQTEAANRIYNDGDTLTDKTMGAGSYMEFEIEDPSYSPDSAREYMACIRVAITDTNTGYIYGYASLDMDAAEVIGTSIKAPLRLYNKDTGMMLEGDAAQYICRMDQNLEKNLTVYVYLDGAKTTDAIVSAVEELSLHGVLNLQFCSSADLKAVAMEDMR